MRRLIYTCALLPLGALALSGVACQQGQSVGQAVGGDFMSMIHPNATPQPAAYVPAQPVATIPQPVTPVTPVPAQPDNPLLGMFPGTPQHQTVPQPAATNGPALDAHGRPMPCPASGKGKREGLPSGEFRAYLPNFDAVACKQQTEVWCWAAGIEMVYKYGGKDMAQEEIVERVHKKAPGDDPNSSLTLRGALEYEVMIAMCPDDYAQITGHPIQGAAAGAMKMMTPGQGGKMRMNVDYMSLVRGAKDAFAFDPTDMVQSISSGSPVLMSLEHRNDPTQAHMYTVYSVTYKPTIDVAGSVLNGALSGGLKSGMASGPRPGYVISEIRAINPWTTKSETFQFDDIKNRIAYMMSQPSVKRAFGEMSNTLKMQ